MPYNVKLLEVAQSLILKKEQIEHLQLHFTFPKIASLLGVSVRTVRRRMTAYGLSSTLILVILSLKG